MFEVKIDAAEALEGLKKEMADALRAELAERLKDVTCSHGDAGTLDVLIEADHLELKGCCEEREQAARAAIGVDDDGNLGLQIEVVPE